MRGAAAGLLIAAAAEPPGASPPPDALAALVHPVPRCSDRPRGSDEIVVCGGRETREARRQALPFPNQPVAGDPHDDNVQRERHTLVERQSGEGMMSCNSTVGPSGMWGCYEKANNRKLEYGEAARPGANAPD